MSGNNDDCKDSVSDMIVSPESVLGKDPMEDSPASAVAHSEIKRTHRDIANHLLSASEEELLKQYYLLLIARLCEQPRPTRDESKAEELDEDQQREMEMEMFWQSQAWKHEHLFRPASADVSFSSSSGQRIGATAALYFSRFYLSNSVMLYPPLHMMCACLYLGAKTEEEDLPADRMSLILARHLPLAQVSATSYIYIY